MVSFPSSLVGFLGFHPYMRLFSFRKLFCDLFLLLFFVVFFVLFRNSKRERWERRLKERCVSIKYDNVHIYTIKNHHKASRKSKQWGCRSLSKAYSPIKPKSNVLGFYEALHALRGRYKIWTLDWNMDWTMDWIMDSNAGLPNE